MKGRFRRTERRDETPSGWQVRLLIGLARDLRVEALPGVGAAEAVGHAVRDGPRGAELRGPARVGTGRGHGARVLGALPVAPPGATRPPLAGRDERAIERRLPQREAVAARAENEREPPRRAPPRFAHGALERVPFGASRRSLPPCAHGTRSITPHGGSSSPRGGARPRCAFSASWRPSSWRPSSSKTSSSPTSRVPSYPRPWRPRR